MKTIGYITNSKHKHVRGSTIVLIVVVLFVVVELFASPAQPYPATNSNAALAVTTNHNLLAKTSHISVTSENKNLGITQLNSASHLIIKRVNLLPINSSKQSAIIASPPPKVPNTTPIVIHLITNLTEYITNTTSYHYPYYITGNFTAPTGPFATIVLYYHGMTSGTVYDTDFHLSINGVPVFTGTSPEYGNWTVLKNLTEYSALFHGTVTFAFHPPMGFIGGYNGSYTTSLALYFYPLPSGAHAAPTPNMVLSLNSTFDHYGSLGGDGSIGSSTVSSIVTVPFNVTSAILELYVYGYDADEFWYADQPVYAPFRNIQVSVNGTPIANVLPFPYINTGGINLFMWRPVNGVFTLNDRPYTLNLTSALGILEGTHKLQIQVQGASAGSYWTINGVLLLYTSSNAGPAVTTSYSFSQPNIQSSNSSSGLVYLEQASSHYSYSSMIPTGTGYIKASTYVSEFFTNNQTFSANNVWQNITQLERTVILNQYTYMKNGVISTKYVNKIICFPLTMDAGFEFHVTKTTNGSYPMSGPGAIYLDNLTQEWFQSTFTIAKVNGKLYTTLNVMSDKVTGTNGTTDVIITLINPYAGIISAVTYVSAKVTKVYMQLTVSSYNGNSIYSMYLHVIKDHSENAPAPYYQATVYQDFVITVRSH